MAKKLEYSFWVGIGKTIKNGLIWGLPLLLTIPIDSVPVWVGGIVSALIYMGKNYKENRE